MKKSHLCSFIMAANKLFGTLKMQILHFIVHIFIYLPCNQSHAHLTLRFLLLPLISISPLSLATQTSPTQTPWPEPLPLLCGGSLNCPLWRLTRSDRRRGRQGDPENLPHDNHLLPTHPAQGSKPLSPCQQRPSDTKPSQHLVPFSSLL